MIGMTKNLSMVKEILKISKENKSNSIKIINKPMEIIRK